MIEIKEVKNDFIIDFFKEQYIPNPFSKFIVIQSDENIIGYMKYAYIYDRIELENILILEKYRNKGYASLLMEYLIEISINRNCINITLEVNVINKKAINLYEKYKFEIVSIRKNYYGKNDGYLMIKKLGD